MNKCPCGKEARLRGCKITVNRRRGITHWIEHMDGTKVCPPGEWSSAEMKPYRTPRECDRMVDRWNHTANAPDQARLQPSPEADCSASELTSQPERPLADRYNELLYAVAKKFPGESRHETALRYIRQAEEIHAGPCMQNAGSDASASSPIASSGLVGRED